MNLREVRTQLIQNTGRYDLVDVAGVDPWADNGANSIINIAQKFLDVQFDLVHSRKTFTKQVVAGDYSVNVPNLRAVETVWCAAQIVDADLTRWKLKHDSNYRHFMRQLPSTVTGLPELYKVAKAARMPSNKSIASNAFTSDFITGMLHLQTTGDEEALTIMLYPTPDQVVYIEVEGLFYTETLSGDDDTSYWTVAWPEALIIAAAFIMEGRLRNTEGVSDLLNQLRILMQGAEFDQALQESINHSYIEG